MRDLPRTITVFLMLFVCLLLNATDRKATDMGAVGDGKTLNTAAIQKAIDNLHKKGGGRLTFAPGVYLTGCIELRSNIELHFEEGAVLMGSANPEDYRALDVDATGEDTRQDNSRLALILAHKATHIALTGAGMIDGNGLQLALNIDSLHHAGIRVDPHYNQRRHRPGETARPKLLFMAHCEDVRVEGLQLRNSACWGLSFDQCRRMTLNGLDILNRAYWNNDGIDLTDCQQVRISHCRINSADDGICLKSYHTDSECRDISVRHCDIVSSASAVKFGTASWGGFRRVVIDSIRVRDTFRSAIAIESVDGAVIDSIRVTHIDAVNTGNPIFIRLGHRAGERPGSISHILISDFHAEVPFGRPDIDYDLRGPEVDFFHNPFPSVISGIPGHPVRDVTIRHASLLYPGRASKGMAYVPLSRVDQIPEHENKYPEFTMFGELPAWGVFARHVEGLYLEDVSISTVAPDFRPPYVMVDVTGEWSISTTAGSISTSHRVD